MGNSLEWRIVDGQRRHVSGNGTVGREKQKHGGSKEEDRDIWRLEMDRGLLAVCILVIIIAFQFFFTE